MLRTSRILSLCFCILLIVSTCWSETKPGADQIEVDTSAFTNNLSPTDDDLQKVSDKLDDLDLEETDPIFSAWNKSTGISITESQISDFGVYLESESDPVYSAWDKSAGISITESQVSDLQNYLTTETDPVFSAWDKSSGVAVNATSVAYDNVTYTTVDAALDALLYVSPDVSGFSNSVGSVEIGSTVASVVLSWSLNKTMTSSSINQGIGSVLGVLTYTHSTSFTTDRTYTITVSDGTNSDSASSAVYFRSKRYWGTNASTTLSSATILALTGELSTSRTKSWSQNGNGQYIYYVYPASFGTATFTVNGLLSTSWTLVVQNHTNASGYTSSYNVYRTNNVQNGTGIQIEVS